MEGNSVAQREKRRLLKEADRMVAMMEDWSGETVKCGPEEFH